MPAVHSYTLPPDKLLQAVQYAHARYALYFVGVAISAAVLLGMIRLKVVPRLQRFPAVVLIAAVVLLTAVFDLPAEMYGHALSLRFHISIESWPSWFWDWSKEQLVSIVVAIAVLIPFYALLRRSPRRWWLYAWLVALPVMMLSVYADPLILEPLFNQFEPLRAAHPELLDPIERLLHRAGVTIPEDHLFEMKASEKTNSLNAYVSGFGPSRRVVLYDTIIRKEQGPPLLTTIGHELGHYVLQHIPKGLAFGAAVLLVGLLLLYYLMPRVTRFWGISSVGDWGSLPVLLLLVLVLSFLGEPIANAYSRWQEHQADVFSLEVTHGLIPDPGQAAADAFQIEGETDLEEPDPNPVIVFWLYTHPPVADRLRFSLEYDPWTDGRHPQFVR
jgi:Zn-dependent protease with chaperone function